MSWLENLERDQTAGNKRLAALLDPDDLPSGREWLRFLDRLQNSAVTDVFIGGSLLIKQNVADIIQSVRDRFDGPITIFPGAPDQVVKGADALLFLSLISGRNPDLLIGRHVEAAMRIRRLGLEVVPTGYMLFGDGPLTTASYMSQTMRNRLHYRRHQRKHIVSAYCRRGIQRCRLGGCRVECWRRFGRYWERH